MPRRHLVALPGGGTPVYRSRSGRREALRAGLGVALAAVLAFCAGCSGSRFEDDALVTGSITPKPVSLPMPEGAPPKGIAASDWRAAKLALDQALVSTEKDVSVPWENAETGARGTATPIGARRADGCRDFMIAVVDGRSADQWIQGAVCRSGSSTTLSQVRVLGRA